MSQGDSIQSGAVLTSFPLLAAKLERDEGLARNAQQRRDTCLTRKSAGDGHEPARRVPPRARRADLEGARPGIAALVTAPVIVMRIVLSLAADALGDLVTRRSSGRVQSRPTCSSSRTRTPSSKGCTTTACARPIKACRSPRDRAPALLQRADHADHDPRDGVPFKLGRTQRLANRAQRRAFQAMYRSCGVGHCDVAFGRCEIHHISLSSSAAEQISTICTPLCARHHHVVPQLGWKSISRRIDN